jgi:hypothetical protein
VQNIAPGWRRSTGSLHAAPGYQARAGGEWNPELG